MKGTGFYNYASGFANTTVDYDDGGDDEAFVYDTAGPDRFVATPTSITMDLGADGGTPEYDLSGMVKVFAFSSGHAGDTAELSGSTNAETFYLAQDYSAVKGSNFYNYASGFANTTVDYDDGGDDEAYVYDTAGPDRFVATPTSITMDLGADGGTPEYDLSGMVKVFAFSSGHAGDTAELLGSTGAEKFYLAQDYAAVKGTGFYNYASGFANTTVDYDDGGDDEAFVYDTAGPDRFVATPTSITMDLGADGGTPEYDLSGMVKVFAFSSGHAGDTAELSGSTGAEKFYLAQEYAAVKGSSFYNYASGFANTTVDYDDGGDDEAFVYDTAGPDRFVATPTSITMDLGADGGTPEYDLSGMVKVFAFSSGHAGDTAELSGSTGAEKFYLAQDYAGVKGTGFYNYASGFANTTVDYDDGGDDEAFVYDTAGPDRFVATPTSITMDLGADGGTPEYDLSGMVKVFAFSSGHAGDTAELSGSTNAEAFYLAQDYSAVKGSNFYNYASGFANTTVDYDDGGDDQAFVCDTAGPDRFVATPTSITMDLGADGGTPEYDFSGMVKVFAFSSGHAGDTAELSGSANAEKFYLAQDYSAVRGSNFYNYASGFATTTVDTSGGGGDLAYIYDTSGPDEFIATPTNATMNWGADETTEISLSGMARVYAFSSGGGDTARLTGSEGNDRLDSTAEYSLLKGDGFYSYVSGFTFVDASTPGGTGNVAYFYDSTEADAFYADSASAEVDYDYAGGALVPNVTAAGFQKIYADFSKGGNDLVELMDTVPGGDSYFGDGANGTLTDSNSYWIYLSSLGSFDKVELWGKDPNNKGTVDAASIDYILQYDEYWEEI